ncbi:hypothetical protein D0Z00_001947 [Geotrichum galactomycetum]|uniref:Uncharacterized protein n=1 Tax=Geotrichum galactomycetum TaxID=27317 RepID=A0ACB6V5G9_9ASCO|nr:hypothetical protein D0Z00_001947 [Geotrichum candidum]
MPQTQGASQMYTTYIEPFLDTHDQEIDNYIVTGMETLKQLGLDYLTRTVYYAREYASHFMFQTDVRPYQPSAASPSATQNQNEQINGSYMNDFFSRFKQPPSFSMHADASASSKPSTTTPPFLSEPNTGTLGPNLWNSVFKAGAAALQSSLSQHQIPQQQQSSRPTPSQFDSTSGTSRPAAASTSNASFSSMLNTLNSQLQTNNASSTSRSFPGVEVSSTSSSSSTSVKFSAELAPGADLLSGDIRPRGGLSQVPSSTSVNSDSGFDIIKHDETGPDSDETSSLLAGDSRSPTSPVAGSSRGWFGWKKSRDQDEFPEKPVKLE